MLYTTERGDPDLKIVPELQTHQHQSITLHGSRRNDRICQTVKHIHKNMPLVVLYTYSAFLCSGKWN